MTSACSRQAWICIWEESFVDPSARNTWAGELMRRFEERGVRVYDTPPGTSSDIAVLRTTREPMPGVIDPRDCNY